MLPVLLEVRCESCEGVVELACEGLSGTVMYQTYNEFLCPHCRKLNRARTPGHIISVSPGVPVAP
jgi:phage FluMu protein Com